MAEVPVETKKTAPAPMPDPFRSLRNEVDRLFDCFAAGRPQGCCQFMVSQQFAARTHGGGRMQTVPVGLPHKLLPGRIS